MLNPEQVYSVLSACLCYIKVQHSNWPQLQVVLAGNKLANAAKLHSISDEHPPP